MTDFIKLMEDLDNDAIIKTSDPKVYVACALGTLDKDNNFIEIARGVNCNYSFNERILGKTYRQTLFNSTDTKYRPWDKIIHAEENAVYNALLKNNDCKYDTAVVTRYPCEKCAQLLIFKGIKKVFYGRDTIISEETALMFRSAGVNVVHIPYHVDEVKGAKLLKDNFKKHMEYLDKHYK